ncbi:hypothetical protein BV898_19061 [Hypsibius exemplaris]|uniref:G-protein coupled receptors family 1 profile domain-containing protein n=1 Tax=Hypsibius exemplaris TaxID=2072580 RepID=A0A9X6NIV4_HYPEX|nr:hypothetical protein BV898_19061 [Hypsibius exemplaris]
MNHVIIQYTKIIFIEAITPIAPTNRKSIIDNEAAAVAAVQAVGNDLVARQILRSHDRVLVYIVCGVVVCWTPNLIYYLLVNSINYRNATFHTVQTIMVFTYGWVNPVLCYMAMRQLREAVNDFLCGRWVVDFGYDLNTVLTNNT